MIEQAGIDDLVRVADEQEQFWGERNLSHLHHPMLIHQFGRTALVTRGAGGEVIAYLFGFVTAEGVGYIHLVGVRQGHRRNGLARALYEEFERRAKLLGARRLESFTQPANTISIAFHTALGFAAEERRDYGGEGETLTVFKKPLGEAVTGAQASRSLGEGASMRPVALADIDELHALIEANRAHLRPWLPFADQPREGTATHVERAVRDAAVGEALNMTIVSDGVLAGMVSFVDLSREHRLTSIGYWLAEHAQGRGLMTRAVAEMVDAAFGPWQLERVEIRVAVENAPSRAVPERLGFRREGELRRALRVDGVFQDDIVFGLLADDPRASRPRG
jgi:ribosomal-protein-serine acetyltransferase